jgi:chromosome segregation protein
MNVIRKLELYGFKSFYNRKEINFPTGLSVVIGPNGSGKSNILEALTFVLGKASRKELRAERLGDLVYNGGKKLPPSGFAKVTVDIDNKNRTMPIEDDLVRISRKVDKEGHSIFRVNGKRETRDYVKSILSHANIDPDGFNIVLQGEIERFVDMSPEERRQLIEDICGVSIYEDKKHKCMLELDKVEQKIKEARIILNEKIHHMEELKKEKDQAEAYSDLQQKLRVKKASKLFKERELIQAERDSIRKVSEKKESEISKEIEKRNKLSTEIQRGLENIEKISQEIVQKGEKEQLELNKKIETLKIRASELKISIRTAESELKKIGDRKTNVLKESENNNIGIRDLERSIQEFTGTVEEKKKKLQSDEEKLDKLKNLDRERLGLVSRLATAENELLAVNQKLYEFERQVQEQKEIERYEAELPGLQTQLRNKLEQDSETVLSLSGLREQHAGLSKRLHQLEGKREALLSLMKRGVKAILAAKTQKKLSGIHGIVSTLGKTDEKYSLPLKVAAGNKINSLVVDDENNARECISYLRTGKLGIATFLPLTRLKPRKFEKDKKLEKMDGVVGYAIDLVKFNKKYEEVFRYVFGNTLIVRDIDTAKEIGINNIRMVTLEGDLIERSGVMVGGWRKKEISSFKETEIEEEIEKLGSNLHAVSGEIAELDATHQKLSEESIIMRNKVYELESRIKKIEIDVPEYERVQAIVKEKTGARDKIKQELEALPKKAEEEAINKLSESIKKQREAMGNSLAELRGKELQIKIMTGDISDLAAVLKTLEKENSIFLKSLEDDRKSTSITEKQLESALEEEKKFHGRLRELYEERNQLNEKIKNLEIARAKIEEVISRFREGAQELGLKIAELNAKIESRSSALEEFNDISLEHVKESPEKLEQQITELQGTLASFGAVNMRALDVYREVEKEYNDLKGRVDKLDKEKTDVLSAITEIETKKKEAFMEAFDNVSRYFSDVFAMLSPEGEGKLVLENLENPFEAGIEIIARPRGKKMISLRAMSGGEKTITTLAFIFAIQEYQPSPFYIMDEVDAALDKENSEKLGLLLAQHSKRSQFIVISHNDNVTAEADNIYGVSMNELGESQVVSLKLPEREKLEKAPA